MLTENGLRVIVEMEALNLNLNLHLTLKKVETESLKVTKFRSKIKTVFPQN